MKKMIKLGIIVFLMVLTTGCVRYQEEMTIHPSKYMDISVVFAYDTNYMDATVSSSKIEELKKLGYQVKDYKDSSYEGISANYHISNIDDVSDNQEVVYSLTSFRRQVPKQLFQMKKGWFYNSYKANFEFDSTDIDPITIDDEGRDSINYTCDDGSSLTLDYGAESPEGCHRVFDYEKTNEKNKEELEKKIEDSFDLSYSVKISGKILSHDATSKKRGKLTWDLERNGITNIHYEFRLWNYTHILLTGILVFIVFIFILFIVKKIKQKKRKNKRKK